MTSSRYRTGIPWRDLPREVFGPWQTAWKPDWKVSVDATIARAHQHGTNATRPEQDTGGGVESQESADQRV